MVGSASRRRVLLLLVLLFVTGCAPVPEPGIPVPAAARTAPPEPVTLRVTGTRPGSGPVLSGGAAAPYNYGPSVVAEDGGYRAWWCSQLPNVGPPGDDVLHASSKSLDSRFTGAVPVFDGRGGGFDAKHTCDPSVLHVGDGYYLYYTGAASDHAHGNAIGAARGPDGLVWHRIAAGEPVVSASEEVSRPNSYGAGQPSAVFLDGWFYVMFTDTTAGGAGPNGAGQFVLRARNAELTDRVQSLGSDGFRPVGRTNARRPRSVVDAFSADLMWVDALHAFALAHQTAEGTTITFWDRGFTRHPYRPLLVPGRWREGPGLVRRPDGHAPQSTSDPCGTVPFDVLRATTSDPDPTGIVHIGLDVAVPCSGQRG